MPLESQLRSLIEIETPEALLGAMSKFSKGLGLQYSSIVAVREGLKGSQFVSLAELPPNYGPIWGDLDSAKEDVVAKHMKSTSVPLIWGQKDYVDAGMSENWEVYSSYGMGCGISQAMHLGGGHHVCVGFDAPHGELTSKSDTAQRVAAFQLFLSYATEAARKVLFPILNSIPDGDTAAWDALTIARTVDVKSKPILAPTPTLTARELECLTWGSQGKTNWEIGMIMNISEATVKKHMKNVEDKLNCTGRTHSVASAIRRGLIS